MQKQMQTTPREPNGSWSNNKKACSAILDAFLGQVRNFTALQARVDYYTYH